MMLLDRLVNRKKKGFTLVELMVVVVIIGVLVAIAIPIFGTVQTNAANRAHEANVRTLVGAGNMMIADEGTAADGTYTSASHATVLGFIAEWPTVPDRANTTYQGADATAGDNYQMVIAGGDVTVTVP